jgi:periplasmic protein CpxP/Spy
MKLSLRSKSTLATSATAAVLLLAIAWPFAATARPATMMLASAGYSADAGNADVMGRVKNLHDQLQITPKQEFLWKSVARAMMANASAMSNAVAVRARSAGAMSAVADILSYQAIVAAHAQGLKDLAGAFAPLYASMSPSQKKNADAVFGLRTANRLKNRD